jgi:type II secretory ATPase GspE/PulE/Tfp pilus assembly ATPase PilB-like protein
VAPFLVASALLGAVAQRLVRTTCEKCKQPYTPSAAELATIYGKSLPDKQVQLYRGAGCNSCRNTGYRGRRGVFEILNVSPLIRKMITDGCGDGQFKQQAIREGMRTLTKAAIDEVLSGGTTIDELMRVVDLRVD